MTFRLKLFSRDSPTKTDGESFKAAADTSGASSFGATVVALADVKERAKAPLAEQPRLTPPGVGQPYIKIYAAPSVAQAMLAARRELGDDAILIQTKRLNSADDPSRQYEVTFGVIEGAVLPTPEQPVLGAPPQVVSHLPPPVSSPVTSRVGAGDPETDPALIKEVTQLRQDIAGLYEMMSRQFLTSPTAPQSARRSARIRRLLIQSGLDEDLASEWALELESLMVGENAADDADLDAGTLEHFLSSRISADASLGTADANNRAVALVGPPAAGKTTALIKLALEYGLLQSRSVEIFAFDPRRVEMNRVLETTASMINIPCKSFTTVAALKAALRVPRAAKTLVLVDTGGFASGCVEQEEEFADFVSSGSDVEVHLVLSAAWQARSLRGAVDYFEIFQPSRLLFTMLDHAGMTGPLLQEAWRTGKPLSFFNNGPLGSGNITPASVHLLLNGPDEPARVQ
ncbi:MAG: hypothetical protein ABI824_18395 [Acidobacteriota bacterium]